MFDLLLKNAVIPLHAIDPKGPPRDAIGVAGGRIVAVGESGDLGRENQAARVIDLGGRALLPGFNDSHVHIWKVGHLLTSLADLRGVGSFDQARERLGEPTAGEWLLGRGVNELLLSERRLPTRHDLDAWFPGQKVWITRACNHVGVASSAALRAAGVDKHTDAPPGGEIERDAAGEPTGVLAENAMRLISDRVPPPTLDERCDMIRAATARQLSLGITAATDPGVDDATLAAYRALDESGELVGRYNVMRLAPEEADSDAMAGWSAPTVDEHLRVDTAKFFLDGGLSGATAALSTNYRHADTDGILRYSVEEYRTAVAKAHAAGYRAATHVIGDRAITTALDALESLPEAARQARFEHFGLPNESDLERTARLGIAVSTQAIFLPELGANFREYLPESFPITPYPIRSMIDAGIDVALSTDAPVVRDERPLAGVAAALNRLDATGAPIGADQAIRLEEAFVAYTQGGARLSGDENHFGQIRPGLLADLVVLEASPFETPLEELADLRVEMTFVGGALVYEN